MSSDNTISDRCSRLSNRDLSAACKSVNRYYYSTAPFLLSKPPSKSSKMLHKTSFRFKRLMANRKSQNLEETSPSPPTSANAAAADLLLPPPKSRVKSWVSRPSAENVNANVNASANAPASPRPEYASKRAHSITAHSSESSLCSCDEACGGPHSLLRDQTMPAPPPPPSKSAESIGIANGNGNGASTSSVVSAPAPEVLYLNTGANGSFGEGGDARTWRLIFSELASTSPLLSFTKSSSTDKAAAADGKRSHNSTFNLLEALSIEPVTDNETTPTPSLHLSAKTTEESVGSVSSLTSLSPRSTDSTTPTEIEALARQTDEAFKAVGTALEEARASTSIFAMPPASASASASATSSFLGKKARKAPIARTKSRAKRTKSARKKSSHREARWTLNVTEVTDGMADIFTGRIFTKGDVEELIDTTKLGQRLSVPISVAEPSSPKHSGETARSTSTTSTGPTPDPFALDSLPIRLTASGLSPQAHASPPPNTSAPNPAASKSVSAATSTSAAAIIDAIRTGTGNANGNGNGESSPPPPIPAKDRRRHDSAISITTSALEKRPLSSSAGAGQGSGAGSNLSSNLAPNSKLNPQTAGINTSASASATRSTPRPLATIPELTPVSPLDIHLNLSSSSLSLNLRDSVGLRGAGGGVRLSWEKCGGGRDFSNGVNKEFHNGVNKEFQNNQAREYQSNQVKEYQNNQAKEYQPDRLKDILDDWELLAAAPPIPRKNSSRGRRGADGEGVKDRKARGMAKGKGKGVESGKSTGIENGKSTERNRTEKAKGKGRGVIQPAYPPRKDELPSTPFTIFAPWRQGGIRLVREEREEEAVGDEMDWTAFQMALGGGVGIEGLSGIGIEESSEEEDVVRWGERLGDGGRVGGWIREGEAVDVDEAASKKREKEREKEKKREKERLRVLRGLERRRGRDEREREVERGRRLRRGVAVEIDGREMTGDGGDGRVRAAGKRKGDGGAADDGSLPPSPLGEFSSEGVPMGFNLGHDLDDYLKWERGVVEKFGGD